MRDPIDGKTWTSRDIWLCLVALLVVMVAFIWPFFAAAHEHTTGETTEQAQVVDFLRVWRRPAGNFEGMVHRRGLCCYSEGPNRDCFPVKAVRLRNGIREVYPETGGLAAYEHWYPANTGVDEDLQSDPRESPDGRSYVCIVGQQVACLVWGSGT